jgi:hypothetical protein
MTDQSKPSDPGERFREFVTEWERGFDALANRFMGTDEFSRAMNQFQNMQLTLQKGFAEVMARQLAAVNLPSREDVLRVGEAVHELDMRVARMELKREEITRAVGVEPERRKQGPPRTKRPPGATAAGA